ncbi:MAG: hypothetical protein K2P17_00620 [Helicobacteraceae bacterium]|nr:hypothetical protein [Helicobacteraceae bacterium]
MSDLLQKKPTLRQTLRLYRPYVLAIIALIMLLWHIFDLLVGQKSLVVLLELRAQERELEQSIKFYKRQNATLQKEIFELIGE